MELPSKSSITFSITGILSSDIGCNKNNNNNNINQQQQQQQRQQQQQQQQQQQHENNRDNNHQSPYTNNNNNNVSDNESRSFQPYRMSRDRQPIARNHSNKGEMYAAQSHGDVEDIYDTGTTVRGYEYRNVRPRLPSLTPCSMAPSFTTNIPHYETTYWKTTTSPPQIYPAITRRLSSSPLGNEHYRITAASYPENEIQTSHNGRFRPPPFFDTVLMLRKRLYYLGGKAFPADEPPCDRNVHKLWRSVEKHKVNYSLQHYFYVASLSNRCFDLVERIHQKVSHGLLEGSREKEVNQSYFNFLYGKTEDERHRLLRLLEKGEISPKDLLKPKHNNTSLSKTTTTRNGASKCHLCKNAIHRLTEEKEDIERKYETLKRKYEKITSGNVKFSTSNDVKKSKSV